ncbi:hypothetical protein NC651_020901 [Populus alba x Populus x berolinensis]|nr:hypothetical protein NC651_020901 [Populus alba x Populus x berolinensis]
MLTVSHHCSLSVVFISSIVRTVGHQYPHRLRYSYMQRGPFFGYWPEHVIMVPVASDTISSGVLANLMLGQRTSPRFDPLQLVMGQIVALGPFAAQVHIRGKRGRGDKYATTV